MDNQIDEVKYQIFETNQTEVNENVLPFEYKNGIDEAFNTDEIDDLGFNAKFLRS